MSAVQPANLLSLC